MQETKGMALMIFTVLNVLGVGFLLYVLAQFWKEGHKSTDTIRARNRMSAYNARPQVVVVTAPINVEARRQDGRVIHFSVRNGSGRRSDGANDLPGRTHKPLQSAAR
jgi:hypothetical protein